MSLVVEMTTVLGNLSLFGTAVGAGLWWFWRRAKKAGSAERRLDHLKTVQAEIQTAQRTLQDSVTALQSDMIRLQCKLARRQSVPKLPSQRSHSGQ